MAEFLNVIVDNGNVWPSDQELLFEDEEVLHIQEGEKDMFDLLVLIGAFSSKGQARKNWNKTGVGIPSGWSDWWVGKLRRRLCIWNPSEWKE
jgi:hypothetical protein